MECGRTICILSENVTLRPNNIDCELHLWSILLNMFYTPMGRFHLGLLYYFTYFSTVVPQKAAHNCWMGDSGEIVNILN